MKILIAGLAIVAMAHLSPPPPMHIGSTGAGTPSPAQAGGCDEAGGELIYTPWTDTWECEP